MRQIENNRILAFANVPTSGTGTTGAMQVTAHVIEILSQEMSVTQLNMRGGGFRKIEGRSVSSALQLAANTAFGLLRLSAKLITSPDFEYFYLTPSSTRSGRVRDSIAIAMVKARNRNTKVVLHIHNGNYFKPNGAFARRALDYCIMQSETLICLSRHLFAETVYLTGDKSGKFKFLPNTAFGVEELAEEAAFARDLSRLSSTDMAIKVVYFSNFIEEKGYKDVLAAVDHMATSAPDVKFEFRFVGNWNGEAERDAFEVACRETSGRTGISVRLSNPTTSRRETVEILLDSDILVLPSYYAAEAQPLTIIEAMVCECAIVATDFRGIRDMIEEGVNGIFVKPRAPREIASALAQLASSDLKAMQKASAQMYRELFSQRSFEAGLKDVFSGD